MKFRIRYADQIVGIFSIAALAGLIALIFALGSEHHWFEKKYSYYTFFDTGSGVSAGMDLTYKGFSIGKVKKVSLEGNNVRVDYYVRGEYYSYIKENSLVQLVTSPIGLGSSFVFYPGKGPELIENGSEIYRVDSRKGQKIIDDNLIRMEKTTDSIGALMNQVSELLTHVNSLVGQVDVALSGKYRGSRITPIQSTVLELNETMANLNKILASDNGVLMHLLGPAVAGDLERSMDNIEIISRDLTGVSGNADKLMTNAVPQVDNALIQLNAALVQMQDVLTGLENNPLLRGGIPDRSQSDTSTTQLRDSDF